MAKFLALVKYTPEACAAIAEEGLASRRVAIQAAMEAQSGRVESFWAVDSFEWNVAFVVETPDDQAAANRVATFVLSYGQGHLENTLFLPLATVEDADAAMKQFTAPRPPGNQ